MKFTTLISVEGLVQNLKNPDWIIIDCRFWLEDTEKGWRDYKESHVPGAVYAHLDDHLCGQIVSGETGRHPLPSPDEIADRLGSWGVDESSQVVVYDDRGGMIASRMWWMLRWLGHETVAVLDGGIPAWIAEGHPVNNDKPNPEATTFIPNIQTAMVFTAEDILLHFGDVGHLLIDSRAPERFRGEVEPIDPIAGRIPGAQNHFWSDNLTLNSHFKIKDVLRGRFSSIFGDIPSANVTFYCGSGVTGAHNVLAVAHSGLGMPRLYPGSWSHWITDSERPIVSGE